MISDDIRNKLSSLDAFLAAETNDIDLAIEKLTKHTDPESLRRRIALLIKAERIDEAYSITKTYPVHCEWIEVGIRAAVLANDYDLAEQFVRDAGTLEDASGTLILRSIVTFTDSLIVKHFMHHVSEAHPVYVCAVEPVMQPVLQKGLEFLVPFCDAIYKRHSISSPLENEAMSIYQIILALLGRSEETSIFLQLLIQNGNINVMLGQFMAEGNLPLTSGFSDALIDSNPNVFDALLFAEIIRLMSGGDLQTIFNTLVSLSSHADDKDKRGMLFSTLSGVSAQGGVSFTKELELLTNKLLDLNEPTHSTRLAIHKIYHKSWSEAEKLLNSKPLPNDPRWLNAIAQCDIAKDNLNEGVTNLVSSALMYKDDRWLLDATDQAFQLERLSDALECLECMREYYPWNNYARKNLLSLLIQEDKLDKAVLESEQLIAILPDDNQLIIQLSYLYNRIDKPELAINKLSGLIKSDEPPLDALLLLASILQQTDSPTSGFDLLDKHKDKFWNKKEFLFAYLNMGYASGHEKQANESLLALNSLREKGEIDPEMFRAASLDELTEMLQESKERKNKINTAILQGKMPWTMSSDVLRRTIYFDWKIRTQRLKWQAEDTSSRSEYSIYSTNRFGSSNVDDRIQLDEIKSTSINGSICVDYSSLVTLHALDKLHFLFSNYENIYIPEKYRLNKQKDRQGIQPHQLSHLKGYEAIRLFLDNKSILIAKEEDLPNYIVIDEYIEDIKDNNIRPLKPLIDCLSQHGKILQSEEESLRMLAARADINNSTQLALQDKIVININTLMSLYRHDEKLLELLVNSFRVYLSVDDKNEIIRDIQGFDFQKETLDKYNDLWNEISSQPNIQYVFPKNKSKEDEDLQSRGVSLLALKIAQEKALPLLVDDRVLQAMIININGTIDNAAFGTDVLLESLLNEQVIEISDYTDSILQLMKWRYKFIVPKAEMLHYLVTRYSGATPGEGLAISAQYLHDCMRDPGLFGGLEKTDPPLSMALKLYITWTSRIGEFLALVWTDESISDKRSDAITEWAAHIMLPSVPTVVQEQFHSKVASNLAEILVVKALISTTDLQLHKRVPSSLLNLSRMIGIADHRHEQLISEVISRAAR